MNYSKLNNLTGWLIFALGAVVFLLTASPTASFWDCGEFIACANEFMVPHPPGAPLFLLIGRLFIVFGFGPENAAYMMNLLSVFASAFTGMFTFWTITMLAKRIVAPNVENPEKGKTYAILAAGLVGGATVFFCSSFWFNAVEAEVYALSSTFSALIFWLMLKWERRAHLPDSYRYIILIAFLIGLSFGVHLLSLLTIPALALVYYFRVYKFTWGGFLASLGISVALLGFVQIFMGLYTFRVAFWFEQIFTGTVNTQTGDVSGMGLPMWTGSIIFFLLLFGGLSYGIYWTAKKQKVVANVALLAALFVYIGMSSYALVFIRAAAEPPINENDPDNMAAIVPYMAREQYGQVPLLYGPMYHAQAISEEKVGEMYYTFENPVDIEKYGPESKMLKQRGVTNEDLNGRYISYADKTELKYAPGGERFFPRMHARDKYRINFDGRLYHGSYYNYVSEANRKGDTDPMNDTPSGGENLAFFFDYQVGHMYLRYFGWNFIGREGDAQSSGSELFYRASKYDNVPAGAKPYVEEAAEYEREQPDRNHYYALPLLLGLLGLAFQITRDPKNAVVVGMLFFAGGLAIVLYLNQPPLQPRERDYSYAGSFTTFCIWIGLGVLAAWELLRDNAKMKSVTAAALAGVLLFAAVPLNMMAVNWEDHSRAGRYVAPDSAYNLLESCEKDAILFTNGDNDTFPLWYLQEVEGIRTDVRVVNLSLLNTDWYIQGLLKQQNEGAPVPIDLPESYYMGEKHAMEVRPNGVIPLKLPTHKDHLLKKGLVTPEQHASMGDEITWNVKLRGNERRWYLMKQDLMIVDMLRNIAEDKWERPFYFAITIPDDSYIGLQQFFSQEGMAQRVLPVKFGADSRGGEVNLDK
ncbi:MAG: protein O-mannosyl-transferase family, partial [Bacteroidota bacterium]